MRRINITKYRKDEKQDTVCFGEASVKKVISLLMVMRAFIDL